MPTGEGRTRARRPSAAACLARLAARPREGEALARVEELCRKLFDLAMAGDVRATRLIFEYLDGRPVERVQAQVAAVAAFTADEAALAERRLRAFRAELSPGGAQEEPAGEA